MGGGGGGGGGSLYVGCHVTLCWIYFHWKFSQIFSADMFKMGCDDQALNIPGLMGSTTED